MAGIRGFLGRWIGGAGSPAASGPPPTPAGVRGLLAPWLGGAGSPTFAAPALVRGVRSLLAFWMGGASGTQAPATTTTEIHGTDEQPYTDWRKRRRERDERDILTILKTFLKVIE